MSRHPDLGVLAISPDREDLRADLPGILEQILAGGVRAFMMREKSLADDDFLELGCRLREVCEMFGATFILNERWELAEPMAADVVHLTWKSNPLDPAKDASGMRVGRSIHSVEECEAERLAGLDYVVAGPVFPTPSKAGLVQDLGLHGLGAICQASSVPVVAVGGIDYHQVRPVLDAGAAGVAGISCFFSAEDPRAAAVRFCEARE